MGGGGRVGGEGKGGGGLFNDSVGGGCEEERMTGGSYKVL